jgi:hypothetical protein
MSSLRFTVLVTVTSYCCVCPAAEQKKDGTVELPPVIVEGSRPKVKVRVGPLWRDEMFAPGVVWKHDHPTRLKSFLFDEDRIARGVFGSKEGLNASSARVSFQKLKWYLEDEWLVFSDQENGRVEELRLINDGWFGLTTERRNGEILKFRVTKPKLQPVKSIKQ